MICEDDQVIQNRIKMEIDKFAKLMDNNYKIYPYTNYCPSLEEVINDSYIKVYILDVNLIGKNGFEIARKIRKVDKKSSIILLTVQNNLQGRALKERLILLDYIVKSDGTCFERLNGSIQEALKITGNSLKKIMIVEDQHTMYPVDFSEMTYLHRDTQERRVIIHTRRREFKVSKNLTELQNQLDERFFVSHRSCIVNIEHVKSVDLKEESITFLHGETIFLLSRAKKNELHDKIFMIP